MVLNGAFAASLVALLAIPLFGWLSDLLGRKTMFYASCLFSALFAFPLFWLLDTRDPTIVICTIVVAITFGQMVMFGIGAPGTPSCSPRGCATAAPRSGFRSARPSAAG